MILTCPECATSYFVDDARIPAHGRTVKCSSCGARWKAEKPAYETPTSEAAPEVEAGLASPSAEAAAIAGETPGVDQATKAGPGEGEATVRSAKRPAPRRSLWIRLAAAGVLALAGVAALAAVVLGGHHGIGASPKQPLVIEAVEAKPAFAAGHPVLSVTGVIRNTGAEAAEAPALQINLLDHAGKMVAAKLALAEDGRVPAGAKRYFMVTFDNPPKGAHDLEVAFAPSHGKAEPAAEKHEAVAAPYGGAPEPEEAKPLAPGTPDALPEHG